MYMVASTIVHEGHVARGISAARGNAMFHAVRMGLTSVYSAGKITTRGVTRENLGVQRWAQHLPFCVPVRRVTNAVSEEQ